MSRQNAKAGAPQIFQISRSHLKILGARRVMWHFTQDPQISGAKLQNLVTHMIWHLRFVCTSGFTNIHCTKAQKTFWQGGLHATRKEADSYAGSSATTSRVRLHKPPWMGSMKCPTTKGRGWAFYACTTPITGVIPVIKSLSSRLCGGITVLPCKTLLFQNPS
jgi:hypothetical protein